MSDELSSLADTAIFSVYLLTRDLTIIAARKVQRVTRGRSKTKLSLKYGAKCSAEPKLPKFGNMKRGVVHHPISIEYYYY